MHRGISRFIYSISFSLMGLIPVSINSYSIIINKVVLTLSMMALTAKVLRPRAAPDRTINGSNNAIHISQSNVSSFVVSDDILGLRDTAVGEDICTRKVRS